MATSIGFGGLYPWPCADIVEAVLLPVEGQTRRIVDVGECPLNPSFAI